MPKKITELTQEQKDAIPGWVDKWIKIGLKTGEADWETFDKAIRKCYTFAGLDGDNVEVIKAESPLVVVTAGPICAQVLDGGNVDEKSLRSAVADNWSRYIGGQGWISWVAYTNFYKDVCHLELDGDLWERNEAYTDALKSAWWWWAHEKFVIVSNRPVAIHTNDQGRLHSVDGPAIHWKDGFEIFSWNGITVPREIIMDPESYTKEKILEIDNTEIRRALGEKLGWREFLKRLGSECVDTWKDPKTGLSYSLMKANIDALFLQMDSPVLNDKSKPIYIEPVHPELKTAQAARKWQFRKSDGNWPTPDECNRNPKLEFQLES